MDEIQDLQISEDHNQSYNVGDIFVVRYKIIQEVLMQGQVQLI